MSYFEFMFWKSAVVGIEKTVVRYVKIETN